MLIPLIVPPICFQSCLLFLSHWHLHPFCCSGKNKTLGHCWSLLCRPSANLSSDFKIYSESSPSPPPLLVHPKPSHCQFLFRLVASQILFGRSDSIKTDQFISPLHLSLIMSSALHWKSNHCSQCSARFSRIWPLLHLWLYPLLPLLLRAHWPLCSSLTTWAYFHSSSFYTCCSLCLRGSSPLVSLFSFFTFCLYIIFSVSPSQLPDLITESTPSFESNTLYFLFLVYFFSKAFVCLLLCLLPARMNLFCFLLDSMLDT